MKVGIGGGGGGGGATEFALGGDGFVNAGI